MASVLRSFIFNHLVYRNLAEYGNEPMQGLLCEPHLEGHCGDLDRKERCGDVRGGDSTGTTDI